MKLSLTTATAEVARKLAMAFLGVIGLISFLSGFRFLSLFDSFARFLVGGVCMVFSIGFFFFPWFRRDE